MFYDYYAFNPPNESTKDKFLSSTKVYRKKHFHWYRKKQKACRYNLRYIREGKEIPHKAIMELFEIHHNRTPQKCFEEFIPLYPKTSSVLLARYRVPYPSKVSLADWLTEIIRLPQKRFLTKTFLACEFELKVFNELNKMNEFPMIENAPQQELRKDKLVEDMLLFLTNVRLCDILKLKKSKYEVWTENYRKCAHISSEESVKVEDLYLTQNSLTSTSESNKSTDSNIDN